MVATFSGHMPLTQTARSQIWYRTADDYTQG